MSIEKKALNIYSIIADMELPDNLLSDNIWKQVDFYRFCCDSKYWQCAHLCKLPRACTENPAEALVYLLQAERKHLQYHDADMDTVTSLINRSIVDGYFTNPAGQAISIAIFHDKHASIMSGIAGSENFEVYKNGHRVFPEDPLQLEDVLFVTAYANGWNELQCLIETTDSWVLFGWSTLV